MQMWTRTFSLFSRKAVWENSWSMTWANTTGPSEGSVSMANDRAGLRTALQDDFQMRPDTAANRAAIAAVVSAWEPAKYAHEEEVKLRQEAKSLGAPRPLPHTDRTAMLRAVEQSQGEEMQEREQPSNYAALLLEEVEQDEVQAHALDEIGSRKDSQSQQLQSTLDQSGRLRITRQCQKGKLPSSTEELRSKLRLEANAWLMVASKMRKKAYLRGLERRQFEQYIRGLLVGGEVLQHEGANPDGREVGAPAALAYILLDYEFEMRSHAFKKARKDGTPLGVALLEATRKLRAESIAFYITHFFCISAASDKIWTMGTKRSIEPFGHNSGQGKGSSGKGKPGKGKKNKGAKQFQATFLPGTKLKLITHTLTDKKSAIVTT